MNCGLSKASARSLRSVAMCGNTRLTSIPTNYDSMRFPSTLWPWPSKAPTWMWVPRQSNPLEWSTSFAVKASWVPMAGRKRRSPTLSRRSFCSVTEYLYESGMWRRCNSGPIFAAARWITTGRKPWVAWWSCATVRIHAWSSIESKTRSLRSNPRYKVSRSTVSTTAAN